MTELLLLFFAIGLLSVCFGQLMIIRDVRDIFKRVEKLESAMDPYDGEEDL